MSVFVMALLIAAGGCRPAVTDSATVPALDPLEQGRATQEAQQPEGDAGQPTPALIAQDTPRATAAVSSGEPEATPSPPPAPREGDENLSTRYLVVFVEPDDVLNVRSGPGVENSIVGALAPGSGGLRATGNAEDVAGSPWLPVANDEVAGWVNSRFLTEHMPSGAFCQAPAVSGLIGDLREAVAGRDGARLADLVDPLGGLRLNRHWWNPTIYVDHEDVSQLFESSAIFHWGTADGTGDSLEGSFADEILPLLDQDLLLANEFGCNEILHGGTAGHVRLPAPYDGIHFISLHRAPDPDGFELDWGTWVAGIERRDGQYYVSYLVHFQWEI